MLRMTLGAGLLAGLLGAGLAGCVAYEPGSFMSGREPRARFTGDQVTVGCLDVAIHRRPDYEASAVLQYQFGNRCNGPIEVDLRDVAVRGRFEDGREVALAPYDPRLEIQRVRLDGRREGGEAIAYPTPQPATEVCVDAASLVHAQPSRWLCFRRTGVDGEPVVAAGAAPEAPSALANPSAPEAP